MNKTLENLGTIASHDAIEDLLATEFRRQMRHISEVSTDAEDVALGYREAALTWIVRAAEIAPLDPMVLRAAMTGNARQQIQAALSDLSTWRLPHVSRELDDLSHLGREVAARRATFALRLAASFLGCADA